VQQRHVERGGQGSVLESVHFRAVAFRDDDRDARDCAASVHRLVGTHDEAYEHFAVNLSQQSRERQRAPELV
jgi:hypothetical protein